jgi:hypothetical protein
MIRATDPGVVPGAPNGGSASIEGPQRGRVGLREAVVTSTLRGYSQAPCVTAAEPC